MIPGYSVSESNKKRNMLQALKGKLWPLDFSAELFCLIDHFWNAQVYMHRLENVIKNVESIQKDVKTIQ